MPRHTVGLFYCGNEEQVKFQFLLPAPRRKAGCFHLLDNREEFADLNG